MNTNTPEEWERAMALAAVRDPPGPKAQGPTAPGAIPVTVELLGLSRLVGKREQVELRLTPHGPLARVVRGLAEAVPALVGVAIDVRGERLAPGYLLNRNGREPLLEEEVTLAPGDHLLLLSAEVGG
jgi:hypothetical protein